MAFGSGVDCGMRSSSDGTLSSASFFVEASPGWRPVLRPRPFIAMKSNANTVTPSNRLEGEVIIVGAGPVGLLLANILGARGMRTHIFDKRTEPQSSRGPSASPRPLWKLLEPTRAG